MKPFILDKNKIYTEEELQKLSPIPLFEDSYFGEDPKNLSEYNNYIKNKNLDTTNFEILKQRYVNFLPEYLRAFLPSVTIGPNDELVFDIDLTEEVLIAMQLRHSLKEKPNKKQIIQIIKADTKDFCKFFGKDKITELF
jgi:hypothetical protein